MLYFSHSNKTVFKFLKFFLIVFLLFIFTFTVVKWLILFLFVAISLPFLFLTHIVEVNFQNLSQAIDIGFLRFHLDIYPTPFPLIYMNPKFLTIYKDLRTFLVYFSNFLSAIIFMFLVFKTAPKNWRRNLGKIKPDWRRFKNPNFTRLVFGTFSILVIFTILLLRFLLLPSFGLYSKTQTTLNLSKEATSLLKDQNFSGAKEKFQLMKSTIISTQTDLRSLSWVSVLPFLKNYYRDVDNIFYAASYVADSALIATDILPTLNTSSLEKIDEITPALEEILNNFSSAKKQIDTINPDRYPKELMGKPIREKIILAKDMVGQLEEEKQKLQPLIGILPEILGNDKPRYYLVLFQNENKIRPTGGFLTAYGIFKVEKGKITPEGSGDIFQLERTLFRLNPAPKIISANLSTPFFYLRDANISPDFYQSMKNFENIYHNSYQRRGFDGILALDGELFVNLLKVLGTTVVYDKILTADNNPACNCPGVIADINQMAQNNRKDIVGIVLNAILVRSISSPPKIQLDLSRTLLKSIKEKHLLFYLTDEKEQKIIEAADLAGRIRDFQGDYLHINEANFSAIEEDRYLNRSVEDSTEINQDGEILKTLILSYQKLPPANQTTSLIIRFYLPKGAKFLDAEGTQKQIIISEDLDKTVFETSIEIKPESVKKITLKYTLPMKIDTKDGYQLLRQKQPGIKGYDYTILFNGDKKATFFLDQDKKLSVRL